MLYKFVARMCAISQDTVRVLIDSIFTGLKNTRLGLCWKRGLVSEETVVLRRWGSETRKFGLSTELIM